MLTVKYIYTSFVDHIIMNVKLNTAQSVLAENKKYLYFVNLVKPIICEIPKTRVFLHSYPLLTAFKTFLLMNLLNKHIKRHFPMKKKKLKTIITVWSKNMSSLFI